MIQVLEYFTKEFELYCIRSWWYKTLTNREVTFWQHCTELIYWKERNSGRLTHKIQVCNLISDGNEWLRKNRVKQYLHLVCACICKKSWVHISISDSNPTPQGSSFSYSIFIPYSIFNLRFRNDNLVPTNINAVFVCSVL